MQHFQSNSLVNCSISFSANMSIVPIVNDASNFVSFSSSIVNNYSQPSSLDPKSMLYESVETKYIRLRTFANCLKQSISTAQNRSNSNENDHAIEHIYQVGTQQRLFVDYRPDMSTDSSSFHAARSKAFTTQTFHGQLHIDDVFICTGQGSNKKICKRHCFQQALNYFLNDNFEIQLVSAQNGQQQYQLAKRISHEYKTECHEHDRQERQSFSARAQHPATYTGMNFVHARDTSTMAGRTARQQNQLEQQYWQQWRPNVPFQSIPRRTQRSYSPPPPVPHQAMPNDYNTPFMNASSAGPVSVGVVFFVYVLLILYFIRLHRYRWLTFIIIINNNNNNQI
jgi:hypothetical protein